MSSVLRFAVRRAGWAMVVVLASVTLVFTLMYGVGDPCVGKLGANARPEQLQACHVQLGMDRPLSVQLLGYLGITPGPDGVRHGLLQGELGESLVHGDPVTEVVWRRLPRTALLGGLALLFQVVLGVAIGVAAAVYRGKPMDTLLMSFTFLMISIPGFLLGIFALHGPAFLLGWFPVGGYGVGAMDHVRHALLPSMVLGALGAATYARLMRGELVDTLSLDHVRTARAKGLSPTRVLWVHGVRNALIPVVTLIGLDLPLLVSGAIVTEEIFAWPGLGKLALESVVAMDAPIVVGLVVVISVAVQLGNVTADLATAWLDPRARQ